MLSETIQVAGFVGCVFVSLYKDPDSEGQDAPFCTRNTRNCLLFFGIILNFVYLGLSRVNTKKNVKNKNALKMF
jgi:hypothetical protein